MMEVIGVDIGGTKIAAGIVNERGEVRDVITVPTLAQEPFEVSMSQVYSAIEQSIRVSQPSAIGICAPGPLQPKTGVILNPPNLPHWRNVPLADMIADRYQRPCKVENDANAAAYAEYLFGAAQGCDTVLYATISTGIGAGIIINGRILHGKNGAAAEGGHVTIDWRSKTICNCGVPGCIEVMASGTAMAVQSLSLEETADRLSAWLGSLISLLDPDIIVLGGGVAANIGSPLFELLRRLTPARTINLFACNTPIVPAVNGHHVGVVGAGSLFFSAVAGKQFIPVEECR